MNLCKARPVKEKKVGDSRYRTRYLLLRRLRVYPVCYENNRVFSHDVTAAILVFQNNETAAMLVFQTNPVGIELFSYVNAFFCSNRFA